MKILILGGTGWVGHQVALQLAGDGHNVTIGCRNRAPRFAEHVAALPKVIVDKLVESELKPVLEAGYDAIVDTVPEEITIDHIAAHARGLKHYIHCSSTGGYTPLPFIPCDETAPYTGFPFGGGWKQKAIVDAKVMDLFHRRGFPATVIRPCYITGSGMLPLDNLGGRRPDFLADILRGAPLDVPDNGLALLQPIHVADLAASFRLAVRAPASIGQIYNICLEKAVTLNTYLEITAAAVGAKPVIRYAPVEDLLRKYGPSVNAVGLRFLAHHMCFDITKAKTQLGFAPRYTTQAAIEETARWAAGLKHVERLEARGA